MAWFLSPKRNAQRRLQTNIEYKKQKQQHNNARLQEVKYYDEEYKEYKEVAKSLIPQLPQANLKDLMDKGISIKNSINGKEYKKERMIKEMNKILGIYTICGETLSFNLKLSDTEKNQVEKIKKDIYLLDLEIEKLEEQYKIHEEIEKKQFAIKNANKKLRELIEFDIEECVKQYYEYCNEFGIKEEYYDVKQLKKMYRRSTRMADMMLGRKNYAKSRML